MYKTIEQKQVQLNILRGKRDELSKEIKSLNNALNQQTYRERQKKVVI